MITLRRLSFLMFLIFFMSGRTSFAVSNVSDTPNPSPYEHDIPKYMVPSPPFTEGIFPCSDCHQYLKVNPKRRALHEPHEDIKLRHAPGMWCLDCHSAKNRDKLHLINGKLIDFKQLYFLCGQCHGTIFRDWKAGVHGKRTGEWNGKKLYRLCTNCHSPHEPHFKPLTPKPPPIPPSEIK